MPSLRRCTATTIPTNGTGRQLEEFYGIKPEGMTAEDVIHIVEKWKEAVVGLDRMVYEDAKKEFSLASMTGFGADGSRLERNSILSRYAATLKAIVCNGCAETH